jgi:aromatic-L-amino-acid/L-tryptophan decarboxylase
MTLPPSLDRPIDREQRRPLGLDADRASVLEHAAALVVDAWASFDAARPEEPPLDERVRSLLAAHLPEQPTRVVDVLDDAARILDESIAQPRPRFFAFIGSSGLEVGTIGDLLASTYDINLAVDAGAATMVEQSSPRPKSAGTCG